MTTTTADWSHFESSVSISLPADVSNSDLFGGDLFGDELIDMYGATTVSEPEPPTNHGILQETNENKAATNANNSNNAGQVIAPKAENASRSDVAALDGLGAFRPCTSFNDFAELLPPSTSPVTTTGATPIQAPVSPATVSVSDSSATLEHQASQPILSYVAGSSTTNNAPEIKPSGNTLTKSMTLAGKNHAAVVPTSLLPTGTGVKVNQQAATQAAAAAAAASQGHTPDPLEASRQMMIVKQHRVVSSNAVAPKATRVAHRSTPDQIKSQPTTIQMQNTPAQAITSNAQIQSKSTASNNPTAISQATITAAAVAAATNAPTAADFTAVAQAAVSNLIMNAGAHSSSNLSQQNLNSPESEENKPAVMMNTSGSQADISTAHVTALTSSNWVSAVNNNTNNTMHSAPTLVRNNTSIASASAHSLDQQHADALAPAAKRRRQNLTPDERAKQNRDRNREHARNTRLRKKAYVEELKRTLTELVTQRDANEMEQRRVAQRELEQREVRFRVAEEFMKLRGDNQRSTARWAAILENEFTFTLPVTKYRDMVLTGSGTTQGLQQPGAITRQVSVDAVTAVDENRTEQVLCGVEESKKDAEHLASFLEGLYFPDQQSTPNDATKNVSIIYDCNRKNFFMDGTSAFLNWTATTNLLSETNLPPLTFKGVLRATFSPASNKLLSAELSFDTGVLTSHVYRIQSLMQAHQGAAAEADAILDSLEMPYFLPTNLGTTLSENISTNPASISSSEKSDSENEEDGHQHVIKDMVN